MQALAEELLGKLAGQRLRRYIIAWRQQPLGNSSATWNNWDEAAAGHYDLSVAWETSSVYHKFVSLVHKTRTVQTMDNEARRLGLHRVKPKMIDQVYEKLHQRIGKRHFQNQISQLRKFSKIGFGFLPFIPLDGQGTVTLRDYEDLSETAIAELCSQLQSKRAQYFARIGLAFQDALLQREKFIWQEICLEGLEKLDTDSLFDLLPVKHIEENIFDLPVQWKPQYWPQDLAKPDSLSASKQCELCDGLSYNCIQTYFTKNLRVTWYSS